jgi:sulfopyruvate decarboxylase subunit alpha
MSENLTIRGSSNAGIDPTTGCAMKQEYAAIVFEALKEAGINFVVYLPEDQIHDTQKMIVEDPSFITVAVANEGEGVAAGAGASLGGRKPALIIADSGFLAAIWPLASL